MFTIGSLAQDAADSVADLLSEDAWEAFDNKTDLEKIEHRYLHADCDDFALALCLALGWNVRAVSGPKGPLHRLVESPEGRLLDVSGWVTPETLSERYRTRKLRLSAPGGAELCHSRLDDEGLQLVVAAMVQLGRAPFIAALQPALIAFGSVLGLGIKPCGNGDFVIARTNEEVAEPSPPKAFSRPSP